jgi:hypothetical protein
MRVYFLLSSRAKCDLALARDHAQSRDLQFPANHRFERARLKACRSAAALLSTR